MTNESNASTLTAGSSIELKLKFRTANGSPCRVNANQVLLQSSPMLVAQANTGLEGIESETEETVPEMRWDSQTHTYFVKTTLKNAGQRQLRLSLDSKMLPLSGAVPSNSNSLPSLVVEPSPDKEEIWFQKEASTYEPVSEDGIEIPDSGLVEIALVVKDKYGNFVSRKVLQDSDFNLAQHGIESSVTDEGNLLVKPLGKGSFNGSLQAINSQAPALALKVQSTIETAGTLAFWVRADSLKASLQDGNFVAEWIDEAPGASENLMQGNTSLRPVFREQGLNGQPSVEFDGSDMLARSPLDFGASSFSAIVVYKASGEMGIGSGARIVNNGHSGWNKGYFIGVEGSGSTGGNLVAGVGGNGIANSTLVKPNDPEMQIAFGAQVQIALLVWNTQNETLELWVNGKKMKVSKEPGSGGLLNAENDSLSTLGMNTLSTDNGHPSRGFRLGAEISTWDLLVGHISEVVVYNQALDATKLSSVFESLARKYSVDLYQAP